MSVPRALAVLALGACAGPLDGTDAEDDAAPRALRALTWNTGTGGLASPGDPSGWTPEVKAASDTHFGNGLAWQPAIDRATEILEDLAPDLVAFQEVFDPATGCGDVPNAIPDGFVCEDWTTGDPSVAQRVVGPGWQVACFPGKPDKCLGVRTAWGTFEGCRTDRCDDVLTGAEIDGCGSGSRVAAGTVLTEAGSLTVVGVHGTSGVSSDDTACRTAQVAAIVDDPGLAAAPGILLGDLNTDPGRQAQADPSAAAWIDATTGTGWSFATSLDPEDPPTYVALPVASIDHILTAGLAVEGCTAVGIDDSPVSFPELPLWDHRPILCDLVDPR